MKRLLLSFFVVSILFCACATGSVKFLQSGSKMNPPHTGRLIVSLSTPVVEGRNTGVSEVFPAKLFFRRKGDAALFGEITTVDGASDAVMHFTKPELVRYAADPQHRYVVVAELPPGEYEICRWECRPFDRRNKYKVTQYHVARDGFSIPFSVRPGEAVYIGSFWFYAVDPASPKYSAICILNNHDRFDLDLAAERFPDLVKGRVRIEVGAYTSLELD